MGALPDRVKFFIFQYVDSVEFLEILMLLHGNPTRHWLVADIARELRSSTHSIEKRIEALLARDLVQSRMNLGSGTDTNVGGSDQQAAVSTDGATQIPWQTQNSATPEYSFNPVPEFQATVNEIAEVYRSHRHRLYTLIYSPTKNARDFAEAFNFTKSKKRGEGEDG